MVGSLDFFAMLCSLAPGKTRGEIAILSRLPPVTDCIYGITVSARSEGDIHFSGQMLVNLRG